MPKPRLQLGCNPAIAETIPLGIEGPQPALEETRERSDELQACAKLPPLMAPGPEEESSP